jgi:hypothetical protein
MVSDGAAPASPALTFRGFDDGLGQRVVTRLSPSEAFEALRLVDPLGADPRCAPALTAGIAAVAGFAHPAFQPPPALDAPQSSGGRAVIVSAYTPGRRLSDILRDAESAERPIETSLALYLLQALLGALKALHAHGHGVFHGAIGPERVMVTPDLRVLVLDHALGPMLAALAGDDPRETWQRYGIAVPAPGPHPPLSPLTDQFQIALVGLALLLGRRLRSYEFPGEVPSLLASATEIDLTGQPIPLDPLLREWFARALLVSENGPYPDLEAAEADFALLLSDESGHVAAPLGLRVVPEPLVPLLARAAQSGILGGNPIETAEVQLPPTLGKPAAAPPDPPQPPGSTREPAAVLAFAPPDDHRTPVPVTQPVIEGHAPDPVAASSSLLHLASALETRKGAPALDPPPLPEPPPEGWLERARASGWPLHVLVVAATIGILMTAGVVAGAHYLLIGRRPARLAVESVPPGATVSRDGQEIGKTPLEIELPRGGHYLHVQGRHSSQTLSLVLRAGEHRRERVELPEAGTPGTLVVLTEPPGADVSIDGEARGDAPLTVSVVPGRHVVSARNEVARIEREISMEAGGKVELALPVSGWVEIVSPVPVRAFVSDRPVPEGVVRMAAPTGRFRVECVNEALGLRDVQEVIVEAGRTAQVVVAGTTGWLDLTADVPDAAVWIDGTPVGRVPLGSLAVPLGPHEVRFVHPKRGEVRYSIQVGMGTSRLHGTFGTPPPPSSAYRRR